MANIKIIKGSELPIVEDINKATFLAYEDKTISLKSGRIDLSKLTPLFGISQTVGNSTTLAPSEIAVANYVEDLGLKLTPDSDMIYSITDKDNRFLFGIRKDGVTLIPKGMPDDVVKEFQNYIKTVQVQQELNGSDLPIAANAIPMKEEDSEDLIFLLEDERKIPLLSFSKEGIPYILNLDKIPLLKDITSRLDNTLSETGLTDKLSDFVEKSEVQTELNASDNPIASKAIPLSNVDSSDSVYSLVDTDNKVLMSFSKDAIPYIANLDKVAISKDTFDVGIVESEEFIYTITDKDDRVLWGIKKDGSFYPKTGNDSELIASSGLLINNLKNQNKTEVELITGTYGGNASVYKTDIKNETSRIVFDFFINENVNTGNEDKTFASIKHSDGSTTDLKIAKRATSLLFGTPNATTHKILQQQPQYNSGFYVGSSFIQRAMKYTEPLIGEDVISIWYKPLFQDVDTVTQQMVRDRANEIEPMRDLAIVMENDSFSIVRDGLDVTDNLPSFNNGTTSVIFSTPLKDGSVWKTLSAFYEELKNAPELVDFDINFYDLSYRKNCGDLLQFGKIKLVGLYTQRFVYGGENERLYDSFPAVLKFAVDNKKHTCEIVYVNNTLYVSIDGDMISKNTSKIESILIGGNEKTNGLITPFDLVVNDGNIGDAEIVSSTTEKRIISERTPYMVGFMGHYLMDNYEPQAQGTQNLGQSLSRMEDVCIELQKRSYVNISIDEMVDYVSGNKKMPKRCAFFVFDDNRVENIYETIRHRQTMSKYGMKGIIGTPSKYYHDNNKDDKMFKMFTSMRGNGWNCMSHTYYHNVPYPLKPSIILHNELKKIIEVADVLNMSNNTLVYSFFGEWENVYALLRLNGYVLTIVNNTPKNYVKSTSRYNIGRCNMADDTNWSAVNSVLI